MRQLIESKELRKDIYAEDKRNSFIGSDNFKVLVKQMKPIIEKKKKEEEEKKSKTEEEKEKTGEIEKAEKIKLQQEWQAASKVFEQKRKERRQLLVVPALLQLLPPPSPQRSKRVEDILIYGPLVARNLNSAELRKVEYQVLDKPLFVRMLTVEDVCEIWKAKYPYLSFFQVLYGKQV